MSVTTYGEAIQHGFRYLLSNHDNVFTIGQGLWSPWYVGSSMKDLDKDYGVERVIDSPISEAACTGAAIGAALCGYRPVVIHPRLDFMILATDQILNEASKWSTMFHGQAKAPVTIRGIINRGGEQGAQHSQALHSMFAHIPGLRVVMPATTADARDLLIASVLSDDPVLYIDDRWLYDLTDDLPEASDVDIKSIKPIVRKEGKDLTLVAAGYSVQLCLEAAELLEKQGVSAEVIDLRMINPLDTSVLLESVKKTGRLCAVDGGWSSCGLAGELIASTTEALPIQVWKDKPVRVTLPNVAAPTSKPLEAIYYPDAKLITAKSLQMMKESVEELE